MPDETPHEDGPEATPGTGRPATGRRVPAPAAPPDDDPPEGPDAGDAPRSGRTEDAERIGTGASGETGTAGEGAPGKAAPAEGGAPGEAERSEPAATAGDDTTGENAPAASDPSGQPPPAGSGAPGKTDAAENERSGTASQAGSQADGDTTGKAAPAASEPPEQPEQPEKPASAGSGTPGEGERSAAAGPGGDDTGGETKPGGGEAPGTAGVSEEALAPSGALEPEEIEEPPRERDPATGAPVNLPATVAAEQVPPATGAPDPAHNVEQRRREAGVDQRFPFGRPGQPLGRAHPFVFGFTAALGVITAWMLVQAASNAKSVIVMIVVAMFLAVGLNPAVERLRKIGLPRGAAVAAVFLGVLLFFAGFVASLVQPITEQVTELRKSIPEYVEQLQNNETLAEWDKRYGLLDRAEQAVNSPDFQNSLTDTATGIGKVAINGVFQTLTILILTLYFLSSLPQIKTFFYKLAPRSRRARVALLGDEILDRIGGYVAGQFTIAFIAGISSYIFLSILGVDYALALSLIVAVTALIPLVGATIGAVVVGLVAFLTGNTTDLIAVVIFYLVYQQVENYVVYPRVMKRTVDVQPAVTIVAALVGAALLGVVGALLAIPTAAAIALLIREVAMPRQETL
ncbi:AI-2E family transporter [Actinomadura welshii]